MLASFPFKDVPTPRKAKILTLLEYYRYPLYTQTRYQICNVKLP